MPKTNLLDGVIFSASPDYAAKHPRDAYGHFMHATDGPDDLKAMFQDVDDHGNLHPVARLAAIDRLEDLGRSREAEMLRHPRHPTITLGAGVFYVPGSRAVSEAMLKADPQTRIIHVSPQEESQHATTWGRHDATITADGFRSDFTSAKPYAKPTRAYPARNTSLSPHDLHERRVSETLEALHGLQTSLEDGEHRTTHPDSFEQLRAHLATLPDLKSTMTRTQKSRGVRSLTPLDGKKKSRTLAQIHRGLDADALHRWGGVGGRTSASERLRREQLALGISDDRVLMLAHASDEPFSTLTADLYRRGFVRHFNAYGTARGFDHPHGWLAPSRRLRDRFHLDYSPVSAD